jgi:hypothetical protein
VAVWTKLAEDKNDAAAQYGLGTLYEEVTGTVLVA